MIQTMEHSVMREGEIDGMQCRDGEGDEVSSMVRVMVNWLD